MAIVIVRVLDDNALLKEHALLWTSRENEGQGWSFGEKVLVAPPRDHGTIAPNAPPNSSNIY